MDELKFYDVDQQYLRYLHQWDPRIPHISSTRNEKFTCGIVLEVNGHQYFAPVSSFREQQRSNIVILNNQGRPVGSVRFSFMFPIPSGQAKMKDFAKEDAKYRELLREEHAFCNKHRERIRKKAQETYDAVVKRKEPLMISNCCAFSLLEEKALEYVLVIEEVRLAAKEVAPIDQKGMRTHTARPSDGRDR